MVYEKNSNPFVGEDDGDGEEEEKEEKDETEETEGTEEVTDDELGDGFEE